MPPVEGVLPLATRVRCESCSEVLVTRHPWDTVGCSCGALTLSGRPWRPRVSWRGGAGGGWSDVTDLTGTADECRPGPEDDTDTTPRRPDALGFAGALRPATGPAHRSRS